MRTFVQSLLEDRSGSLKFLMIGFLTLLLLIPLALVEGVIEERSYRHGAVLQEIASQHGGEQRLVGPLLAVPYVYETATTTVDEETKETKTTRKTLDGFAIILPEAATTRAALAHDVRKRGIYEAPIYTGEVEIEGAFLLPDLADAIPDLTYIDWSKAALILGVSDLSGLTRASDVAIDGGAIPFDAGPPGFAGRLAAHGSTGFTHAPLGLASDVGSGARFSFKTAVSLNGSGGLYIAPVAGATSFVLVGDWPHPSFQGAPLPAERQVTADGFSARWNVPALARGYGKVWTGGAAARFVADAGHDAIGFRLARPDDFYVAATRAAKYGVLFTALTFLSCFVLERFGGKRLHAAQYGMVGLSLALFYLLLIALAERIGLAAAYGAASAAIVTLNAGYVGVALRSLRRGMIAGGALAALYAVFFVMLTREDDALLVGSGVLLAGLALAMAATARIGERKPRSTARSEQDAAPAE